MNQRSSRRRRSRVGTCTRTLLVGVVAFSGLAAVTRVPLLAAKALAGEPGATLVPAASHSSGTKPSVPCRSTPIVTSASTPEPLRLADVLGLIDGVPIPSIDDAGEQLSMALSTWIDGPGYNLRDEPLGAQLEAFRAWHADRTWVGGVLEPDGSLALKGVQTALRRAIAAAAANSGAPFAVDELNRLGIPNDQRRKAQRVLTRLGGLALMEILGRAPAEWMDAWRADFNAVAGNSITDLLNAVPDAVLEDPSEQSLVWDRAVSRRMEDAGRTPRLSLIEVLRSGLDRNHEVALAPVCVPLGAAVFEHWSRPLDRGDQPSPETLRSLGVARDAPDPRVKLTGAIRTGWMAVAQRLATRRGASELGLPADAWRDLIAHRAILARRILAEQPDRTTTPDDVEVVVDWIGSLVLVERTRALLGAAVDDERWASTLLSVVDGGVTAETRLSDVIRDARRVAVGGAVNPGVLALIAVTPSPGADDGRRDAVARLERDIAVARSDLEHTIALLPVPLQREAGGLLSLGLDKLLVAVHADRMNRTEAMRRRIEGLSDLLPADGWSGEDVHRLVPPDIDRSFVEKLGRHAELLAPFSVEGIEVVGRGFRVRASTTIGSTILRGSMTATRDGDAIRLVPETFRLDAPVRTDEIGLPATVTALRLAQVDGSSGSGVGFELIAVVADSLELTFALDPVKGGGFTVRSKTDQADVARRLADIHMTDLPPVRLPGGLVVEAAGDGSLQVMGPDGPLDFEVTARITDSPRQVIDADSISIAFKADAFAELTGLPASLVDVTGLRRRDDAFEIRIRVPGVGTAGWRRVADASDLRGFAAAIAGAWIAELPAGDVETPIGRLRVSDVTLEGSELRGSILLLASFVGQLSVDFVASLDTGGVQWRLSELGRRRIETAIENLRGAFPPDLAVVSSGLVLGAPQIDFGRGLHGVRIPVRLRRDGEVESADLVKPDTAAVVVLDRDGFRVEHTQRLVADAASLGRAAIRRILATVRDGDLTARMLEGRVLGGIARLDDVRLLTRNARQELEPQIGRTDVAIVADVVVDLGSIGMTVPEVVMATDIEGESRGLEVLWPAPETWVFGTDSSRWTFSEISVDSSGASRVLGSAVSIARSVGLELDVSIVPGASSGSHSHPLDALLSGRRVPGPLVSLEVAIAGSVDSLASIRVGRGGIKVSASMMDTSGLVLGMVKDRLGGLKKSYGPLRLSGVRIADDSTAIEAVVDVELGDMLVRGALSGIRFDSAGLVLDDARLTVDPSELERVCETLGRRALAQAGLGDTTEIEEFLDRVDIRAAEFSMSASPMSVALQADLTVRWAMGGIPVRIDLDGVSVKSNGAVAVRSVGGSVDERSLADAVVREIAHVVQATRIDSGGLLIAVDEIHRPAAGDDWLQATIQVRVPAAEIDVELVVGFRGRDVAIRQVRGADAAIAQIRRQIRNAAPSIIGPGSELVRLPWVVMEVDQPDVRLVPGRRVRSLHDLFSFEASYVFSLGDDAPDSMKQAVGSAPFLTATVHGLPARVTTRLDEAAVERIERFVSDQAEEIAGELAGPLLGRLDTALREWTILGASVRLTRRPTVELHPELRVGDFDVVVQLPDGGAEVPITDLGFRPGSGSIDASRARADLLPLVQGAIADYRLITVTRAMLVGREIAIDGEVVIANEIKLSFVDARVPIGGSAADGIVRALRGEIVKPRRVELADGLLVDVRMRVHDGRVIGDFTVELLEIPVTGRVNASLHDPDDFRVEIDADVLAGEFIALLREHVVLFETIIEGAPEAIRDVRPIKSADNLIPRGVTFTVDAPVPGFSDNIRVIGEGIRVTREGIDMPNELRIANVGNETASFVGVFDVDPGFDASFTRDPLGFSFRNLEMRVGDGVELRGSLAVPLAGQGPVGFGGDLTLMGIETGQAELFIDPEHGGFAARFDLELVSDVGFTGGLTFDPRHETFGGEGKGVVLGGSMGSALLHLDLADGIYAIDASIDMHLREVGGGVTVWTEGKDVEVRARFPWSLANIDVKGSRRRIDVGASLAAFPPIKVTVRFPSVSTINGDRILELLRNTFDPTRWLSALLDPSWPIVLNPFSAPGSAGDDFVNGDDGGSDGEANDGAVAEGSGVPDGEAVAGSGKDPWFTVRRDGVLHYYRRSGNGALPADPELSIPIKNILDRDGEPVAPDDFFAPGAMLSGPSDNLSQFERTPAAGGDAETYFRLGVGAKARWRYVDRTTFVVTSDGWWDPFEEEEEPAPPPPSPGPWPSPGPEVEPEGEPRPVPDIGPGPGPKNDTERDSDRSPDASKSSNWIHSVPSRNGVRLYETIEGEFVVIRRDPADPPIAAYPRADVDRTLVESVAWDGANLVVGVGDEIQVRRYRSPVKPPFDPNSVTTIPASLMDVPAESLLDARTLLHLARPWKSSTGPLILESRRDSAPATFAPFGGAVFGDEIAAHLVLAIEPDDTSSLILVHRDEGQWTGTMNRAWMPVSAAMAGLGPSVPSRSVRRLTIFGDRHPTDWWNRRRIAISAFSSELGDVRRLAFGDRVVIRAGGSDGKAIAYLIEEASADVSDPLRVRRVETSPEIAEALLSSGELLDVVRRVASATAPVPLVPGLEIVDATVRIDRLGARTWIVRGPGPGPDEATSILVSRDRAPRLLELEPRLDFATPSLIGGDADAIDLDREDHRDFLVRLAHHLRDPAARVQLMQPDGDRHVAFVVDPATDEDGKRRRPGRGSLRWDATDAIADVGREVAFAGLLGDVPSSARDVGAWLAGEDRGLQLDAAIAVLDASDVSLGSSAPFAGVTGPAGGGPPRVLSVGKAGDGRLVVVSAAFRGDLDPLLGHNGSDIDPALAAIARSIAAERAESPGDEAMERGDRFLVRADTEILVAPAGDRGITVIERMAESAGAVRWSGRLALLVGARDRVPYRLSHTGELFEDLRAAFPSLGMGRAYRLGSSGAPSPIFERADPSDGETWAPFLEHLAKWISVHGAREPSWRIATMEPEDPAETQTSGTVSLLLDTARPWACVIGPGATAGIEPLGDPVIGERIAVVARVDDGVVRRWLRETVERIVDSSAAEATPIRMLSMDVRSVAGEGGETWIAWVAGPESWDGDGQFLAVSLDTARDDEQPASGGISSGMVRDRVERGLGRTELEPLSLAEDWTRIRAWRREPLEWPESQVDLLEKLFDTSEGEGGR